LCDAVCRWRQVMMEHGGPVLIDHPLGPRPLSEMCRRVRSAGDIARRNELRTRKLRERVHVDAPTVIRTKSGRRGVVGCAIEWVQRRLTTACRDEQMSAL